MKKYNSIAIYIFLALLLVIPIFGHLDTLPLRLWDESRLAINAYYMHHNGNYWVTYFDGQPDLWNTKPPLLIWLQVFWIKIIGLNEISLRLPSSLAAFFTIVSLLIVSVKYLKNAWFGFIATVVLITSYGYMFNHGIRTANYDSLLTMFTTLGALSIFAFTETKKNKYLYLFFISTALAVLTKSISGLLFLPAIAIYMGARGQIIEVLKNKHFYYGSSILIGLVLFYYGYREYLSPGYLEAVQQNELGGRFNQTLEFHDHGFWFYFDAFIDHHFSNWYLLVPVGVLVGLVHTDQKIKRITLFSSLLILQYFLVISTAQTKLSWYDIPMYPFLAIIVTVFLYYIFELFNNSKWIMSNVNRNVFPVVFLFLIFITPYRQTLDTILDPNKTKWDESSFKMGYFLKEAIKNPSNVEGFIYLTNTYDANNEFYIKVLQDKGVDFEYQYFKDLKPNSKIITEIPEILEYIENNYVFKIIEEQNSIQKIEIHARK